MFNKEDDYSKATKHARVNTYVENDSSNIKWTIINFLLVSLIAYSLFSYLKNETTYLSDFFPLKKSVLGVSERVDEHDLSDEELMKILKVTFDEREATTAKEDSQKELTNLMSVLVNESAIKSPSSYTKAISRELDDENSYSEARMVVVKKGDTLSSLAEKYYGNSREFFRIIEHNPSLEGDSTVLKIGQTINIPY